MENHPPTTVQDAEPVTGSSPVRAIRAAKNAAPGMAVMTETCLCSYTTARTCVLTDHHGRYDHNATLGILGDQALRQAEAGGCQVEGSVPLSATGTTDMF
ncbi:hypothetical protein [Streptomonospora salina]|uniref:Delta-aminolevulinic acid dehydratase n=1 Tax=Streptomonospora salina TaxID=104205 RepID=A0A841EA25_9ACTN|nr:hypothetical protein [Streptomonospora salina]MBB5999852.1 delta-aminolevulinic acid dehydratase/porphobilinogen synthase [Streptomonospora salina]